MKPNNENNFLIEVTPAIRNLINQMLSEEDDSTIVLHYSPYWSEK